MSTSLLAVEGLTITFPVGSDRIAVVDGVSLSIMTGEAMALVGESGCGKSMTALALMRLVPKPGRLDAETCIKFGGRDLLALSVPEMRAVRGAKIAMIFQEPMTSLNPVVPVGEQVIEAIRLHEDVSKEQARTRAVDLFRLVGISTPERRLLAYPHQLSGGLKQRVMIAMATALRPSLLVADEPTTALDATVRGQILELLHNLQQEFGTAILLITHDFGAVNAVADKVAVMYAGQIVEEGTRLELLGRPHHPYTQCLLRSIPRPDARDHRLEEIPGVVPQPGHWPAGCRFSTRCPSVHERCRCEVPGRTAVSPTHAAWCHLLDEEARP